jgi:hypothetical protein
MLQNIFETIKSFFKIIYSIIVTLPRDLKGLHVMTTIESKLNKYDNEHETVPKLFFKVYKKNPSKSCFIFDNSVWTFEDVR